MFCKLELSSMAYSIDIDDTKQNQIQTYLQLKQFFLPNSVDSC